MRKDKIITIIEIILIISFFIFFSYLIQTNFVNIKDKIGSGFNSMIGYVFVVIISIVVAPISAFPLLPIASQLWGWFIAGILSIVGWSIGSIIAFSLARKYGVELIKKIIPLEKIAKYEKIIPQENVFLSIVFLRMSVPVDLLSYALGLFSRISFGRYALATVIGITPFAFIFAYAGTLPFYYQLAAFLIAIVMILVGLIVLKSRH